MRESIRSATMMIAILTASPATASVILDTGPGPDITSGVAVYSHQYLAGEFVIDSSDTIRSVFGWIGGVELQTINVRLYSDGGSIPGSLLYSGSFVTSPISGASWQGTSDLDWFLQPGAYWISFEGASLSDNYMPNPAPNPLGHYAYWNIANDIWLPDDALRFGIFAASDRLEPPPAPVPEPSTWATMLFGFAAIGFFLRRKHFVEAL